MRSANTADASASEVEICEESTIPPKRWVVAITWSATVWTSEREVESCIVVLRSTLRPVGGEDRGVTASDVAPLDRAGAADFAERSVGAASDAELTDWLDAPPGFALSPPLLTTMSATTTAAANPATGDQASHDRRGGALRASSTRASSRAAKAGSICGRWDRTSATSSVNRDGSPASARSSSSRSARTVGSVRMAGLPELGDGTVQAGARGGLAGADDLRDLGIGEAGVELQGDQLAIARIERRQRGAHGGAPLGIVVGLRDRLVGRVGDQTRGPRSPAQLVQGGVARDAEQPCALVSTRAVEAAPLAQRALERERCDVLRGRAVAK